MKRSSLVVAPALLALLAAGSLAVGSGETTPPRVLLDDEERGVRGRKRARRHRRGRPNSGAGKESRFDADPFARIQKKFGRAASGKSKSAKSAKAVEAVEAAKSKSAKGAKVSKSEGSKGSKGSKSKSKSGPRRWGGGRWTRRSHPRLPSVSVPPLFFAMRPFFHLRVDSSKSSPCACKSSQLRSLLAMIYLRARMGGLEAIVDAMRA